jgi:hypothetical protein
MAGGRSWVLDCRRVPARPATADGRRARLSLSDQNQRGDRAYARPVTASSHVAPGSGAYPQRSRAIAVLVLGILAITAWGPFGPFAWWLGSRELAAIDAGKRSPHNRSMARVGRILGILGTVLLIAAVALFTMALTGIIYVD